MAIARTSTCTPQIRLNLACDTNSRARLHPCGFVRAYRLSCPIHWLKMPLLVIWIVPANRLENSYASPAWKDCVSALCVSKIKVSLALWPGMKVSVLAHSGLIASVNSPLTAGKRDNMVNTRSSEHTAAWPEYGEWTFNASYTVNRHDTCCRPGDGPRLCSHSLETLSLPASAFITFVLHLRFSIFNHLRALVLLGASCHWKSPTPALLQSFILSNLKRATDDPTHPTTDTVVRNGRQQQ
jgi:hypothetical protein